MIEKGSGKTYTISGNKTNPEEFGIIPRAVHTMFQIINSHSGMHSSPLNSATSTKSRNMHHNNNANFTAKEFTVKVNFIEIYKEELKDLLDTSEKDIQIREDESGNTCKF